MTLRTQATSDFTAILANTDEHAEELEFAGETVTGIIDRAQQTVPGGAWPAQARTETVLYLPSAALDTFPAIGAMTTLNGADVMVIDRWEEFDGMMKFILQ